MTETDDLYTIQQVLSGNTQAYEALVVKYQRQVWNIVYRLVQQREVAEEVAQDVFVKVYHVLNEFKQEAKFSTWLYRIAYNAAISHLRKKNIVSVSFHDEWMENMADTEFFNDIDDMETLREAHLPAALQQLSAEAQLLISMYYQQEMSIAQISEITGISESNVKVKLYRSRKSLYDYISSQLQLVSNL